MSIQWYPGHMAKAKKNILESLKLVDVVIEVLDARIPMSSKNPDIDGFAKGKKRIIALNKFDLADLNINTIWKNQLEKDGAKVIMTNSIKGSGINEVYPAAIELMAEKIARQKSRGRLIVPVRAMVVGIPNVGKSTFINKLHGKKIAKTGDRPGVTKSNQWIKVRKDFELLDTPGILWPKFEDEIVGLNLAFTGAIKDEIMDIEGLSIKLISALRADYPELIKNRYSVQFDSDDSDYNILEKIGASRGFLKKGQVVDIQRSAIIFLDEFRGGVIGNITLEKP